MSSFSRVLAVDDNPSNLAIIEEALQGRFELQLAPHGLEALRVAPIFQPDIVLLDVMMPRMSGYEVCRRIKSEPSLAGVRIVMVSARVTPSDRRLGYKSGADDYLTKPFSEEELVAKIKLALEAKRSDRLGHIEKDLERFCGGTADVLAMMASLRGAESSTHLVRIRSYCQVLAGELRVAEFATAIDDVFLDNLFHASVLHDVGKIGLPDSILQKRGKLTCQETEAMREHTLIGERILHRLAMQWPSKMTVFRMAANIARWHHENWDGSGHPDGRQGDNIPLEARIARVADALDDVITREQRNHPSGDPALVLEMIRKKAGTDLDPQIVRAASAVFEEIIELHQENDPVDSFELVAGV